MSGRKYDLVEAIRDLYEAGARRPRLTVFARARERSYTGRFLKPLLGGDHST